MASTADLSFSLDGISDVDRKVCFEPRVASRKRVANVGVGVCCQFYIQGEVIEGYEGKNVRFRRVTFIRQIIKRCHSRE